ncbi:hypothetical protein [Cytobacillus praedii]
MAVFQWRRNPSILIVGGNNNDVLVCYGEYDQENKDRRRQNSSAACLK